MLKNMLLFLLWRNVYKPLYPIHYYMYATAEDVQVGTYPDFWQKGRYRVELTVELPCDLFGVHNALQQLGYRVTDTDQWGRTYHHNQDHNKTVELDEVEDPAASLKLILRYGDVEEAGLVQAEEQLNSLYNRICQMCRDVRDDCDYEPLDLPGCAKIEQYYDSGMERG